MYLKGNRTVRFEDEHKSDRLLEESDVDENSRGIENHPLKPEHFSLKTMYAHEKTIQLEASTQKQLNSDIMEVTDKIREAFVEFYNLLNETPLFISKQDQHICTLDFEQYLESLKMQLAAFEKQEKHSSNVL